MASQDIFGRVLSSLYDAMLDDAHWPATSALIDDACGTAGNALLVGEGTGDDVRVVFMAGYLRGQRREDLERDYLENYHPWDERVPRIRKMPDGRVVHATELYTEQELKTSRTYNEYLLRASSQNGLNVRLAAPDGSHTTWAIVDPVTPGGWGSSQVDMVQRLLPHVRQYVRVRHALASAEALGASLTGLLDNTMVGVIHLDRRGKIVAANDRARGLLRRGDGLMDQGGFLRTWLPGDNARLEGLLSGALPTSNEEAVSGSMTVRRSAVLPRFTLHVSPVGSRQAEFGMWPVAALVLVVEQGSQARVDLRRRTQVDPGLVAATLGLTPAESQLAAMLAEGMTVRDIAAGTNRKESTIRWHLHQIYTKQGISGQTDLVRLALSLAEFSQFGR